MADLFQDPTQKTFYQLAQHDASDAIPEYVKTAEFPSSGPEDLALYADPVARAYPLNSPANTWLSAAYFGKQAEINYAENELWGREVRASIEKAAAAYGIQADVKAAFRLLAPVVEKVASDNDNWGFIGTRNGVEHKRYPLFNADDVKQAEAYYSMNRKKYPQEIRTQICAKLLAKAAEYGVGELQDVIRRDAQHGIPKFSEVAEELIMRVKLAQSDEAKVAYGELLKAAADARDAGTIMDGVKMAAAMSELDVKSGLDDVYGRGLHFPEDSCFAIPVEKLAAEAERAITVGDLVFDLTKLAGVGADTYAVVLGDDFVARVSDGKGGVNAVKLASALRSLPLADQKRFVQNLNDLD